MISWANCERKDRTKQNGATQTGDGKWETSTEWTYTSSNWPHRQETNWFGWQNNAWGDNNWQSSEEEKKKQKHQRQKEELKNILHANKNA